MVLQLPISIYIGAALVAIAFFMATVSKNPIAWVGAFSFLGIYFAYWIHKALQILLSFAHPG
jgi:hypothetical protein